MEKEQKEKLAAMLKESFQKAGVNLSADVIHRVIEAENCGSCWNVGCKDGCSSGCLSACKSGNK